MMMNATKTIITLYPTICGISTIQFIYELFLVFQCKNVYNSPCIGGAVLFRNPLKRLDHDQMRRSSDLMKKQRDDNKTINVRLRITAAITCVLFSLIATRLIYIQYAQNDEYKIKLENFESKKQKNTTPRGTMIDGTGKVVVNTTQSLNITYYPPEDITTEKEWDLAIAFTKQFGKNTYEPTEEEMKKLYLMFSKDKNGKLDNGNHLLSSAELKKALSGDMSTQEVDNLKIKKVTLEDIETIDSEIRDAYGNYLIMNSGQSNVSKIVLENASNEQASYLVEHKSLFDGFDLASGWSREYPYGLTFADVFGKIGSIPQDEQLLYQAKNYSLNEKVGISGLEKEYEDLLGGSRIISEIKYDENGKAIFNETSPGKKGYDIQLSVDIELQQKLDEILKKALVDSRSTPERKYFKDVYVVLMNPNDGRIYAMSGVGLDENGETFNYASGNYLNAQSPGSIVKGATIYMGLNEGVIQPGEQIFDGPMYFKGTAPKKSYNDYGWVSDIGALEKSSNVYMFNIAIRLGKGTYVPNAPLNLDTEEAFPLMRYYYSMFGLGTTTGLDVPYEETGYKGYDLGAGLLLDFSIGQYDTYTPIQLAQYAATIANNGYRVKPRLVIGAYEVNDDAFVYENKAEFLSKVQGNLSYLERTQLGFRACVTSGRCGTVRNNPNNVAAKTGTAETFVMENGQVVETSGAALIGYAPYENPRLSFACIAPNSSHTNNLQANICSEVIMSQVLDEFFKKY